MDPKPERGDRTDTRPVARCIFGLLIAAGATAIFFSANELPPTQYEPLGPAALPKAAAAVVFVLSLLFAGQGLVAARSAVPVVRASHRRRPGLMIAAAVITTVYVASFGLEIIGYRWATVAFLCAMATLLTEPTPRRIVRIVVGALFLGIGTHLLFTRVFVVGLP